MVDPEDRATDDEALKASWLNRRYSVTVRNPIKEEMNLAKDSVLRYAKYSKIRQMALMGTIRELRRLIVLCGKVLWLNILWIFIVNLYFIKSLPTNRPVQKLVYYVKYSNNTIPKEKDI